MPPKINESPEKGKPPIVAGATADCVFHQDIMLCILTRLPVKSILRFKSVCKPWRDLFSTRDFIKMHQGQFSSDPKNHSVIIHTGTGGGAMFLLNNIESDHEKKPSILDHPCLESRLMKIVGCYNGLLCMGSPRLGRNSIVLWNLAMKLFKFVRVSEYEDYMDPQGVSLGFGYDAEGDDFKVVRIVRSKKEGGEDTIIWVELYSVHSDYWTIIDPGFQFFVHHDENLWIVNGNPYWCATVDKSQTGKSDHIGDVLVWFDVKKKVFAAVPVRTHDFHVSKMADALVDWKGCLGALVRTTDNSGLIESLDVWVFDGGEGIWRKNHTFGRVAVKSGRILQCSKNGKMVCSRKGKLFVFDPETAWVKVYDAEPLRFQIFGYLYTEGLTYIQRDETNKC